jgi:hypothetical protein
MVSIGPAMRGDLGHRIGHLRGRAELPGSIGNRPRRSKFSADQIAQPVGAVQIGPFGALHRQRLAQVGDFGLQGRTSRSAVWVA